MPVSHKAKSGALLTGTEWENADYHVEDVNTIADAGSAESLDATTPVHDVTLTEDCTISLTGATSGQADSMVVLLRQDPVGGRSVTWPASVEWPDGSAPTLATGANELDVVTLFTLDGGTTWYGFHANKRVGLTIEDADASPQITATSLVFENGTLVDEGSGVASYTAPTGSGSTNPEHTLFSTGSAIDMSAADTSNVTAASAGDYGTKLTFTDAGVGYWDVASAIGTGDFDVALRLIWCGITEESGESIVPLLGLVLWDSSRTETTKLTFNLYTVSDSGTTNKAIQAVVGNSGASDLVHGLDLPIIMRIKRTTTTIQYFWAPWQVEGVPVWHELRGTTSSLDVGRIGIKTTPGSTNEVVALVHWVRDLS